MPTLTTDFSIFDQQELVTYESMSVGAIPDVPAIRRPLTQSRQRNVERYIELQSTDVIFHLDNGLIAETPIMAGDTLTDAGSTTYSIVFIERQVLNNSVAAVCRPPAA